jgi:hypothetical protein
MSNTEPGSQSEPDAVVVAAAAVAVAAAAVVAAGVKAAPQLREFGDVFIDEYRDIHSRTPTVAGGAPANQSPSVDLGLTGIALSGGGIRSATFSLGVLQAISAAGILPRIHYLSTVSGGGYIGTAMTVGMSTSGGTFPFSETGGDIGETPETRHLRDNSRYLIPYGLPSVISAFVIYLRGIAMNVLVVVPFILLLSAALIFWKPDTLSLTSNWGWVACLPHALQAPAMPASFVGTVVIALLLVVYAIGVSIFPIQPLWIRRLIAQTAAYIFAAYVIVVVFELHFLLLKLYFQYKGATAGTDQASGVPGIIERIKQIVSFLTPAVVATLPFIRTLSEKAISEKSNPGFTDGIVRWASRILLLVVAAIVPLLLWLLTMQFTYWGIADPGCQNQAIAFADCTTSIVLPWAHAPDWLAGVFARAAALPFGASAFRVPIVYLLASAALMAVWPFLNVNANSLHQLYRDRMGSAFLVQKDPNNPAAVLPADNFKLTDIKPKTAPYHLINTALNVPGSSFANKRGRNADFFVFSHRYIGSEATGYIATDAAEKVTDGLNIGTAMAVSGAAAAPNMGTASLRPLSPTIAFFNVRLGRWLRHPLGIVKLSGSSGLVRWWRGKPGPFYLLREAFSKSGAHVTDPVTERPASSGFVFLTDGGHIENLGIYELLRRRCAVIIAVDAEADPDYTAGSLVQLERFAQIDLGTRIIMDWKEIGERSRRVTKNLAKLINAPSAGPHVALGRIDYPPAAAGGNREQGVLIYIKASLSGDENDYVLAYKAAHPRFPQESTMEQLFTEEQVEVYRSLGEHIAGRFIRGEDAASPNAAARASSIALIKRLIPEMNPI